MSCHAQSVELVLKKSERMIENNSETLSETSVRNLTKHMVHDSEPG